MHQQTGSVYLDAPTRRSRVPIKERGITRARVAATAVGAGVVALTIAVLIITVRLLVLDTDLTMRAFEQTLDDPLAREEIQDEVGQGIVETLVGPELIAVAAAFELDVAGEAERVSLIALDDESVRAELRALAEDLHSRVLVEADASDVDLRPLTAALIDVIEVHSPRLATIIPQGATLWTIDGESLPDFTVATSATGPNLRYFLLASLLIPIGLAAHPRRHQMAGWMGRWIVGFGLICGIAAVALPYLGGALTGLRSAEIAIRVISLKLLAPAALSGIVGMGLVSFAAVLRKREQRRVADEGAAAALGYDEPPLWHQPAAPTLDLPARGLVDAGRPLTNI